MQQKNEHKALMTAVLASSPRAKELAEEMFEELVYHVMDTIRRGDSRDISQYAKMIIPAMVESMKGEQQQQGEMEQAVHRMMKHFGGSDE